MKINLEFPEAKKYTLKHAIRLNGVVDVWNNGKTVYCIPDNEYKNFSQSEEKITYIRKCLLKHEERDPIKKLKSGNMSYQEFKNNKFQKTKR